MGEAEKRIRLEGVALLLVDIQYDFIDGSLAVQQAAEIIAPIQRLLSDYDFDMIVASQDYHPHGHISFASSHRDGPGLFKEHQLPHPIETKAAVGEKIKQMMWPDHCIQGTRGAQFHSAIQTGMQRARDRGIPVHIVQKGTDVNVDGYSAFADNQYLGFTELPRLLYANVGGPIHTIVVVGLATDYCVMSSAIDARKFRFKTILIEEAMRGVAEETVQSSLRELAGWGAHILPTTAELQAETS